MALKISKVLISDKIDLSCKELLEKNSICVDYKPGLSKEDITSIIENYDALIVRSATKITAEVFKHAKNLKLVGRAGTGVDNIDLEAASSHGVLVMNTPSGNTLSAAEHTCALIAACARNIGQGYASMLNGKWDRSKLMGCELMGKTLAIVGLGRIGREVAHRMQSYGMKTIGFDPLVSKEEADKFGVEYMPLEEIWPVADFVTVHVPLIPPTKGMINAKVFDKCKPSIKVINVARGGIVDEADLLAALNSGKCGGAALDVFVAEPPQGVSLDLVKHPKVLSTPHLGASTVEAQLRVAREIAQQIVDGVNGKAMVGLVNAPALSDSSNPAYTPWIAVAENLGKLFNSSHTQVNLFTNYESTCGVAKLMAAAFSLGIVMRENPSANLINATSLLKKTGVQVQLVYHNHEAISIAVDGKEVLSGVVVNGKPALSSFGSVQLCSPVVMTANLVTASSTSLSPSALMKMFNSIEISCISTGSCGSTSVAVASVEGSVNNLQDPLTFVEL